MATQKQYDGFLTAAGIREFVPVLASYTNDRKAATPFEERTDAEVNRFVNTVVDEVQGLTLLTLERYPKILDKALVASGERQVNLSGGQFKDASELLDYVRDSAYLRFLSKQRLAKNGGYQLTKHYFANKDDLDQIFLELAEKRGVTDGKLQINAFEAQWALIQVDATAKGMQPALDGYFNEIMPRRGSGRGG